MADIMAMLAASAHHRATGFANKILWGEGGRDTGRLAEGVDSGERVWYIRNKCSGRKGRMQAGGGEMYFGYGETELQYLRSRDKRMGEVIDRVGMIRREVDPDLFAAVVHHIVGQQISTKAQATVWRRMQEALGTVDAGSVLAAGPEGLQALGISGRKAAYITDFALRVQSGAFDPETVRESSDAEAIRQLCTLKGVGVWTAEMICCSACKGRIFSAMTIWPSSGDCGWCITTGRWAGSCLRSIGGGTAPMAAWPVSICGRWPEVLCRSCGTMHRRERKGRSDMTAWQSYASPVGELLLAADGEGLTGLWLAGEKYFPGVPEDAPQETPVLAETKRWLDIYFAGGADFLPPPSNPLPAGGVGAAAADPLRRDHHL